MRLRLGKSNEIKTQISSQFFSSAWITLGYPVSETPNEPKFVGSITRVNMWQRVLSFEVEIPSQVWFFFQLDELLKFIVGH